MPILAILGSLFMVVATVYSHKTECVWYLIAFAVIMLLSLLPLAAKSFPKRTRKLRITFEIPSFLPSGGRI